MNTLKTQKQFFAITLLFVFAMLAIAGTPKAQVRITGAFGVNNKTKLLGELRAGYKFRYLTVEGNLLSMLKDGTYAGVNIGPHIRISDKVKLIPYTGLDRFIIGNTHKQDRYVHNGATTVLTDNRKINSWAIPVGVQFIRRSLYINAGMYEAKEKMYYMTIGVLHLL